jgi:glycosyltransferase involved in cell wall biosynthesis
MDTLSISVVFPAFNQENLIEQVILNAINVIEELTTDYEIIVIDDGSTDLTPQILANIQNKHLKVVTHSQPVSLSKSLKEGLYLAQKDYIIYAEAVICIDLLDIKKAIHTMKYAGADIISAYRFMRIQESLIRQFLFYIYNIVIRFLFSLPVRDINFSFKLLKKYVLDDITLKSDDPFLDTELLVKAYKKGYIIHQIGVDYFYRKEILTPIVPKLFWNTFVDIIRLIKDLLEMKK